MTTGVVPYGSDLKRRKWMREGLIQSASKSFWSAFTGNTRDAIVFQAKNENADSGHTVVFDFDGNLSGKATRGKETAYGKGEEKLKFSSTLTVDRYRLPVSNGDKFDGKDIGDLSINEHSDSRSKLSDLFVRFKDQALFDSAQGNLLTQDGTAQATSHNIDLAATFDYNTLADIERILMTSQGFSTGGIRRPLDPYMTANGEPVWLFVIDAAMEAKLRQDPKWQSVMGSGDYRGTENRLIKGVIGKVGRLLVVRAEMFFGETTGSTSGWSMNNFKVEIAGLRQYDGANSSSAVWTGQEGFDYGSSNLHSRGLLMGAGALQMGFGKMPDYRWKPSQDFDIDSESALEVWMEVRKTKLKAENKDYAQAKVADLDFGVVTVDVQVGS